MVLIAKAFTCTLFDKKVELQQFAQQHLGVGVTRKHRRELQIECTHHRGALNEPDQALGQSAKQLFFDEQGDLLVGRLNGLLQPFGLAVDDA
ncbi:hypothetical protein D3C78_1718580 [compost metagenome]